MKLATFNLESFGSNRPDEALLSKRIKVLRPRLLELDADILCLQEVNAQKVKGAPKRQFHDLDHLLAATPYEAYHRLESEWAPGKGPSDKHNLAIISRYPITAAESLFSQHTNPPLWQPRMALPAPEHPEPVTFDRPVLKARIDIGLPAPLHLFVVHLRAPIAAAIAGGRQPDRTWRSVSAWAEGYHLSVMKQTAQALELRLAVETLFEADETAQILLAGDFNATGETGTLRLLRADPGDTRSPHLDRRRLFQIDAALPLEKRKTVLHRGHAQTLDHVLASPGMTDRVTGVRVFNADLPDEVFQGNNPAYAGSYHAAMRVEFALD